MNNPGQLTIWRTSYVVWRCLVDVEHWSLTTLREKLTKIGAKVARHTGYVTFQLAEVAATRRLFAAILDRIERLALPPPVNNRG